MSQNILLYTAYSILSATAIILLRTTSSKLGWPINLSVVEPRLALIFMSAAAMYIASFGAWVFILSRTDVTIAYPICIGLTMLASTVLAITFLDESLTAHKLIGMLLLFFGVFFLSR